MPWTNLFLIQWHPIVTNGAFLIRSANKAILSPFILSYMLTIRKHNCALYTIYCLLCDRDDQHPKPLSNICCYSLYPIILLHISLKCSFHPSSKQSYKVCAVKDIPNNCLYLFKLCSYVCTKTWHLVFLESEDKLILLEQVTRY